MARRRYKRAAKALTQLSRGKQETKFAQIKAQNIRAGTEAALESMNKKFEMAGQALVTADALAQEYKTKGKVEKGVTSLAEAKGGDVSYKKTGLGDIFRGEGKLSEWGKETWTIGEDKAQYDRADILAWEEKGRKDLKWESVIGKEVTQYDNESGGMTKTRTKPTTPKEPKKYSITGESELYDQTQKDFKGEDVNLQDKYGEGWSYKKQRAIDKMPSQHQSSSRFSGEEILKRQVGANVESANYSKISKAFKSEYGKDKSLMTGIKAYDIQHEEWKESQTKPILKADDKDLEGVVVSSTAVQEDIKPESPLTKIGEKLGVIGEKLGIKKYADGELDIAPFGSNQNNVPEPIDEDEIEYSLTGRPIHAGKMSKDYWGERKGIDVWEKFKEGAASRSEARTTKRTERKEAKAKAAITKLTSGDDFVSAGELEELEAGSKIEEADLSFDDDTRLSLGENPHDKDKPALTSTFDSKSGDIPFYTDASGESYTESDVTGDQDFTNPQIAIQRGAEAKMDYKGSVEQNIGVLEDMMGSGLSDLTGEGSMYEGMGVTEIWNTGPLGEQYGKWNTLAAKSKRKSMWAQIQETNYGASYGK